ncbi:MAG: tetratricopeptide repeat protein [Pseudomonadota bacterium]
MRPFLRGTTPAALVTGILTLGQLPSAAATHDLGKGLEAMSAGNYVTAQEHLEPLATADNMEAQLALAQMYLGGLGVKADEYKAFDLYFAAAKGGDMEAQFRVGTMYLDGIGVTQDEYIAAEWLTAAAEQGHESAKIVCDNLMSDDFTFGC